MTCSNQVTDGKKARYSTTIIFTPYNCKLIVSIVVDLNKELTRLYKKHKIKEEIDEGAEGVLITPPNDSDVYYLIIDRKYLTHNTIAHEVFHAAVTITEERAITDEESQAWIAGHISGVIYKFLEKKKLTIKHG